MRTGARRPSSSAGECSCNLPAPSCASCLLPQCCAANCWRDGAWPWGSCTGHPGRARHRGRASMEGGGQALIQAPAICPRARALARSLPPSPPLPPPPQSTHAPSAAGAAPPHCGASPSPHPCVWAGRGRRGLLTESRAGEGGRSALIPPPLPPAAVAPSGAVLQAPWRAAQGWMQGGGASASHHKRGGAPRIAFLPPIGCRI